MKKIIALLLVLMLLVGCGETPAPVSSNNQDTSSADDTASVSSVESVVDASSETPTTSTVSTASIVSKMQTITTTTSTQNFEITPEEMLATCGGVIPKDGVYFDSAAKKTRKEGERMPKTPADGDYLLYGDYKYTYIEVAKSEEYANYGWNAEMWVTGGQIYGIIFGALLENINGKPLKTLNNTFSGCERLKVSPELPDTVEVMYATFEGADALLHAPKLPKNLKRMNGVFSGCYCMTTMTEIPSGVTTMKSAFSGCTSLINASHVTIPSSCVDMSYCFYECWRLETAPKIAEGVEMMGAAFYCTKISKAPVIPSTVRYLNYTFSGCGRLSGEVVINANPTYYEECFKNVPNPITITGATTLKDKLLATQTAE